VVDELELEQALETAIELGAEHAERSSHGVAARRSVLGARNHAARQMRFRASRRLSVTHQGSPIGAAVVFLLAPAAMGVSGTTPEEHDESTDKESACDGAERCSFCGRPCGRFTRTDYLLPPPRRWRWHRAGARR